MMEKLSEMKRKFFKFFPKQSVASSMAFQNPNLSPCRNVLTRGSRSTGHKVSIIPKEARRKHRSASFSAREPGSPKVSCMGQVHSKKKRDHQSQKQEVVHDHQQLPMKGSDDSVAWDEKKDNILLWVLKGSDEESKESGKGFVLEEEESATQIAPSLGTMKKFTSGRGSLSDFDVTLAER